MVLQNDIKVLITDQLDRYRYDLLVHGRIVDTQYSEDEHRYAVVTLKNGHSSMLLRESHTDAIRTADIEDPNTYIAMIIQN